jgi:superfamily I DNA and RNA helicase
MRYFSKKEAAIYKKNLREEGLKMKDIVTIAKDMFTRGSSMEYIMKITGLQEEEIKNCLCKNNY